MRYLTKKQRNEVYKRALADFMAQPDPLCCIIDMAALNLFGIPVADDTCIEFIEFATFKPENKESYQAWWPLLDNESRIDCLNKCIELTNPKTKTK
jgi:hypothetical protein